MLENDYTALPLRERKKVMLRDTIIAAAERLFEERGFDNVTVAEIADAANVSVKTLFVYFRSKEDLAFADTALIDGIFTALRQRPPNQTHTEAVAEALVKMLHTDETNAGLEGYHRGFGESEALKSGLLRLWASYEDRLTDFLASEAGVPATPAMRFYAMQLVALPRSMTSPELRTAVTGLDHARVVAFSEDWLRSVARRIGPADWL